MSSAGKIKSAFAVYDSLGKLHCKLCKEAIADENEWKTHCVSKKHLRMIELLKERAKKNKAAKKQATHDEEVKNQQALKKLKELEMPIEQESTLPKGVLPDNFFDDKVEGAVAMGSKRKEAEKKIQEKEWEEFKKFEKEQTKKTQEEEEEVLKTLEDRDNAYELQTEAYRLLLENMKSKKDKLSDDALKEIESIIVENGGDSEYIMSKEEMAKRLKERKREEKKKKRVALLPFDNNDWRC